MDEPTPRPGRALSPEEVGARVSAILEAAERDARAVIDAAHRDAPAVEAATIDELAQVLSALSARVEALERSLENGAAPRRPTPLPVPAAVPARDPRSHRAAADHAARVRAVELALAGYSRDAIARELTASLPAGEIDALLDEVLSR